MVSQIAPFEFATATRIVFGAGVLKQVGPAASAIGKRALVVMGLSAERGERLVDILAAAGVESIPFPVAGEPTVRVAREGVELARQEGCDLVIGMGGGSAVDTGKAVSALLTNPGEVLNYLEVVGKGRALAVPPAPYFAIPTTAGTGAEVTRNAVLGVPEQQVKVSLRSPLMLPRLALVDPELTYSLPPEVTASTGLDALTQLIEPYVSNRANPLTDALCREGMAWAARSLRQAYHDGGDPAAREGMSLASLFGGLALANAGLGAAHGFAAPLGGRLGAPHGALCARLLPVVMEINLQALRTRQPQHPALERYTEVARILTGRSDAAADDGAEWVRSLVTELHIPDLSTYGLNPEEIPVQVEKASKASSMQGNPIQLTEQELSEILERAL